MSGRRRGSARSVRGNRDSGGSERRGRLIGRLGTSLLVLAVLVALGGIAQARFDLYDRWFGDDATTADPAQVPPPDGVDLPDIAVPRAVAATANDGGRSLAPRAVRAALQQFVSDPDVGRHFRAVVAPLDPAGPNGSGGRPARVVGLGSGDAIPASTTKLVTTTAALLALGPDHRFATTVVRQGRRVVLVGGGDPYLTAVPDPAAYPGGGDLRALAKQTAAALRADGVRRVRLGFDTSLFPGPAINPEWEPGYVPDVASPIESLWVDQGHGDRYADPATAAAKTFAGLLADRGIAVTGAPTPQRAPGDAEQVASVLSAPLEQIVERILLVSDNNGAEVLLRHLGVAGSGKGSVGAGLRAERRLLTSVGVGLRDTELYDGSGLSRHNRMNPRTLIDVLQVAASPRHPELRSVLSGLPIAGFTGSLADRMDHGDPAGLGRVRAKTGTLMNVQALAGVAVDLDGRPMVFALMLDRIVPEHTLDARQILDDAAAALGACHCFS